MNTKPTENIAFTGKVRNSRRCKVWRSLLLGLGLLGLAAQPTMAQTNEPANKPAVVINRGDITFVEPGPDVEILREIVKASKPTDLLLSITAESSIITNVTTVGNDKSTAEGKLEVYLTVRPQFLAAAPTATPSPGTHADTAPVVFANRVYERETTLFNDEDATIRTFMNTRHAAGFNWAVLNVGSGTWYIQAWARYTEPGTQPGVGAAEAAGAIGARSLVVQPAKCEVRETIGSDTDPNPPPIVPITLN